MCDFPECDHLPREFRSICRGERYSIRRTNEYRAAWLVDLIPENVAIPRPDHNKKPSADSIIVVPKCDTNNETNVAETLESVLQQTHPVGDIGVTANGNCLGASAHQSRWRGLGDVVAAVTAATGIDGLARRIFPCGCGCEKRREKLNELISFE